MTWWQVALTFYGALVAIVVVVGLFMCHLETRAPAMEDDR